MEIEIVSRKDNPLLGRTEVEFKVLHDKEATPKRDAVREKLAANLNSKKGLVVVDMMTSVFGRAVTKGYAKVYAAEEKLISLERHHVMKRNNLEDKIPKARKAKGGNAPAKAAPKKR
ncbi:MAG TPA: 30S ribosomal protein S24e [Candidatus Thermoplasmatota archaeon]|nr:30S ribosomal protein S24e [Candidatus Thermoplasmatota archaeon]